MRDNLDPERQVDLFICQLSTNDATRNSPLGEISESRDLDSFDVKTVCGAIEYIMRMQKKRGTAGSCSTLTHSMIPVRTQRWWKHF